MKLLNEYSPIISYLSVTRFEVSDPTISKFKNELGAWLHSQQIPFPKHPSNWLNRLFGKK